MFPAEQEGEDDDSPFGTKGGLFSAHKGLFDNDEGEVNNNIL